MDVISVSDTSSEVQNENKQSLSSCKTSLLCYNYEKDCKTIPGNDWYINSVKQSKIITCSPKEVLYVSSEPSTIKIRSTPSTERCPVTWMDTQRKHNVEIELNAVDDLFTPSPRNKVNKWIDDNNLYHPRENSTEPKLPFTELHLDSLTASVSHSCGYVENKKSSILVRQDYKKETDTSFETASTMSVKSRNVTPVSDMFESCSRSACCNSKNCEIDLTDTPPSTIKVKPTSNNHSESVCSNSSSKTIVVLQNPLTLDEHKSEHSIRFLKCNSIKSKNQEKMFTRNLKNVGDQTDVVTISSKSSLGSQNSYSLSNDYFNESDTSNEKFNLEKSKLAKKLKSKMCDQVPLSPESQKKNELCSYLRLVKMNSLRRDRDGLFQNRRSTRVKHLAQLLEKKELEKKLNSEVQEVHSKKFPKTFNVIDIIDITSPETKQINSEDKQASIKTNGKQLSSEDKGTSIKTTEKQLSSEDKGTSIKTTEKQLSLEDKGTSIKTTEKHPENHEESINNETPSQSPLTRNYFTKKGFNQLSINYENTDLCDLTKQNKENIKAVNRNVRRDSSFELCGKNNLPSTTTDFDETMNHFLENEKILVHSKPTDKKKLMKNVHENMNSSSETKSSKADSSSIERKRLKRKRPIENELPKKRKHSKLNNTSEMKKAMNKKSKENKLTVRNNKLAKNVFKISSAQKNKSILMQSTSPCKNQTSSLKYRFRTISSHCLRSEGVQLRSTSLKESSENKFKQLKDKVKKKLSKERIYPQKLIKSVFGSSKAKKKKKSLPNNKSIDDENCKGNSSSLSDKKSEHRENEHIVKIEVPEVLDVAKIFNTGVYSTVENMEYKTYLKSKLQNVKADIDLLENLTPEHRKALFESKKFANVTPKVNVINNLLKIEEDFQNCIKSIINKVEQNCDSLNLDSVNEVKPLHNLKDTDVSDSVQKIKEEDVRVNNNKEVSSVAVKETPPVECVSTSKENDAPPSQRNGLFKENFDSSKLISETVVEESKIVLDLNNSPQRVYNKVPTPVISNTQDLMNKTTPKVDKQMHISKNTPEASSVQIKQMSFGSFITSPIRYAEISPSYTEGKLPLQRYLTQGKRRLDVNDTLNSENNLNDSSSWNISNDVQKSPRVERKLVKNHNIQISPDDGTILKVYYVDYNLVIAQEFMITFWRQSPLGNVLGAQDMWIPNGSVQRLVLDNDCVHKEASEMVVSTENSIAYIELWTKEHKSDKRERPVADIFATVYFWMSKRHGLDKKVLQLENIKGHADDVQYVVLKNSRNIVVTWSVTMDDVRNTIVRCYKLAPDYQTVSNINVMKSVSHYISSLHNIEDCDTLIVGFGEHKMTLWNVEYGYIIVTIDLMDTRPHPNVLWTKCDRGFLFVLRHFSDGGLQLLAINGINYSWKRLQTYEPTPNYDSLQGVCMENGLMVAFYESGVLCWKVKTGEIIFEGVPDEDVLYLPCGNHVVTMVNDQICVKNALEYVLTMDES